MDCLGNVVRRLFLVSSLFAGAAVADSVNLADPLCGQANADAPALTNYLTGGTLATCRVGDSFTLSNVSFSSTNLPSTTVANLTLGADFIGGVLAISLQGFGGFVADGTTTATALFNFTIDPAPIVDSTSISLDPPRGVVSVTQLYRACANSVDITNCSTADFSFQPGAGVTLPPGFDGRVFTGPTFTYPQLESRIDNDNTLTIGPDAGSTLDGVVWDFQTVPEPGTWALLASSLAVIGVFSRRRRR